MNVCELRGLKIPQGDDHERRAMIASELADDEAERAGRSEFDYWELGGEKGIETSDGFNVNVMSVTRPWIDQVAGDCQRVRLDCWAVDGTPLAMARAVEPRRRACATAIAPWPSTGAFPTRRSPWSARAGRSTPAGCTTAPSASASPRLKTRSASRSTMPSTWSTSTASLPPAQRCHRYGRRSRRFRRPSPTRSPRSSHSLVEQIERTLRFVESQRRHQHPDVAVVDGRRRERAKHRAVPVRGARHAGFHLELCRSERDRWRAQLRSSGEAALFGPALCPFRLGVEGRMKTAHQFAAAASIAANGWCAAAPFNGRVILLAALSTIWLPPAGTRSTNTASLQRQLDAVAREGRPRKPCSAKSPACGMQIDKLQQHQTIAQELEQQRQVLALLGRRQPGRPADRGTTCASSIVASSTCKPPRSTETGGEGAPHAGTVTLVGVALDSPTVAEFHDGLLQSRTVCRREIDQVERTQPARSGTVRLRSPLRIVTLRHRSP